MNNKIIQLISDREAAVQRLSEAKELAHKQYNEFVEPYYEALGDVERALNAAQEEEASQVAADQLGLKVGDVIELRGHYSKSRNGKHRIVAFETAHAYEVAARVCKLKKDGSDGLRDSFSTYLKTDQSNWSKLDNARGV